jgi:hypothetical protein
MMTSKPNAASSDSIGVFRREVRRKKLGWGNERLLTLLRVVELDAFHDERALLAAALLAINVI